MSVISKRQKYLLKVTEKNKKIRQNKSKSVHAYYNSNELSDCLEFLRILL